MKTLKRCRNFSIVEVIVVCAVVAILASLIMSASSSVREAGKRTTCINNLKQIQVVYEAYRKDHRKAPAGDLVNHDDFSFAKDYVSISDLDTFICPGDKNADQMTSLDHLDGHTSYSYIPEQSTAYAGRANYELAGNDEVLSTLTLVAFDKNGENHNGDRNIVYLHGSGNSNSGIAKTLKAGSYEWSVNEEVVYNDNASNDDTGNIIPNEEEEIVDNVPNEEEIAQEALKEVLEEIAELEDDLVVVSEEVDAATEQFEEANAAEEVAEEAVEETQAIADEANDVVVAAAADLAQQEEALDQAEEALENGPQGYDSQNITLPDDNVGNTVIVNTDVTVTLELLGSGFSSNSIYSDITVGNETHKWQDENGDDHSRHVVGVEGLTLDLDVETGLNISVNGRSSWLHSANLQGNDNLMVYRDGDKATSIGGYNGQDSVKTFLNDYIDSNGYVTIGADQVIFLMELGTTNKRKSYYDMQDLVVLATFEIVSTEADVTELEGKVQEAKDALITATTNANAAAEAAAQAILIEAAAEATANAAADVANEAQAHLEEVEEAILTAEEEERALRDGDPTN